MFATRRIACVCFVLQLASWWPLPAAAETFTLGYLTGSQRRPGNLDYSRPGITISGAISLAVNEVNGGPLRERYGHTLAFAVGETFGEEVSSIRQTASLWTAQVAGYIGPQETCVHEGRMAAAFNLPMISYFCTHKETSNKRDFPTFARTRPPDTQISKSVVSLLVAYNWTQVTVFHQDSEDDEFGAIAETVLATLRESGIRVQTTRTWQNNGYNHGYHHGYMQNPFDELVEGTFRDTRIYVILGHQDEHVGLMLSLKRKGLLDKGEYFVVGVDIEQYNTLLADKYLRGLLQETNDADTVDAFRSYLAIVPSAHVNFDRFSTLVNKYLEMEPFNYPNPLGYFGVGKEIRAEAAYLYDAVHLYAKALISVLDAGANPRNGTAIVNAIKGSHYVSAMGYQVYIDANGDAAGNYSILAIRSQVTENGTVAHGLYPIGTFGPPSGNQIPKVHQELQLFDRIAWIGLGPPIAEPRCGFRGEKCISYTGEISAGIAGGALLLLGVVSLVLYRNWRYEQELDSLLWKVDFREIQMHENDKDVATTSQKQTRASHPLIRTSQVSLSSNPDADFRYSTIFTPIGLYKGQLFAIKKVRKKSIDISREMKMELKLLRDLRHDNICAFIGACTDAPNICIITEYCTRGSLKDVLENEDVKLDNMFTASMVADIIRGMMYLQESPLRFHGSLCTSNCLIDSRWVVKLSDFGLQAFKKGLEDIPDLQTMAAKCQKLLYRAPELLRCGPANVVPGSAKGDIYSFAIVLYEIHTRHGPFGETGLSAMECLKKVLQPPIDDYTQPFRPPLTPLESSFDCVRECLRECWSERPDDRPDFKTIRAKLRPLRKGMRPNIFDNMMAMMEKYANNLEQLVDERTDQLQEEKKKTEALLLEMLPRPVAEQLKKGNKVEAENFDMVTIYFSDIVGFTAMSAESTPLQVVDFLNDLYTCFDSIIGNYDVYKVETIGDAYMVVSGLPIRNGILHAAEIASMSLHLLGAVREFRIRHRPQEQLLLRIGIHSGPVCSGVVGLKMPRYCLFGDTVNTASRMESTGMPLRIHCSGEVKELLDRLGGYECEDRGLIAMKGKGEQRTYWLQGEDEQAREFRTRERTERRGSRALVKASLNGAGGGGLSPLTGASDMLAKLGVPADACPRSSLKNRNLMFPRGSIPRSSSLESPKKLRFASGNLLEHHRYHHRYSDDGLMDVVSSDSGSTPRKASGLIQVTVGSTAAAAAAAVVAAATLGADAELRSSCPCMENVGQLQRGGADALCDQRGRILGMDGMMMRVKMIGGGGGGGGSNGNSIEMPPSPTNSCPSARTPLLMTRLTLGQEEESSAASTADDDDDEHGDERDVDGDVNASSSEEDGGDDDNGDDSDCVTAAGLDDVDVESGVLGKHRHNNNHKDHHRHQRHRHHPRLHQPHHPNCDISI